MANADQPTGFKPRGPIKSVAVALAGGTIYPGDAIKRDANGKVVVVSASNASCGVALHYAVSGDDVVYCDDPDQKYVVQADGSDIDAQTDINLNYNIVATSGDTAYKISRMELDSDTGATDSTLPLRLLSIDKRPDNALGAQVDCIVKINNHQDRTGAEGV